MKIFMTVTNVEAWLDDSGHLHRTKGDAEMSNRMRLRDKLINKAFSMSDKLHTDIGWQLKHSPELRSKLSTLMWELEGEGLI